MEGGEVENVKTWLKDFVYELVNTLLGLHSKTFYSRNLFSKLVCLLLLSNFKFCVRLKI
jgi:hypothetical protein